MVVTQGEQVEQVIVDLRHARLIDAVDATNLEVLTTLVGELMEELALVCEAVLSLDGTGVEANSLVPRVDGVVVVAQDAALAVV